MDEVERESPAARRLPRSEKGTPVSVLWSAWPGWIRTHLPEEDDLRRRDRAGVLLPNPRPRAQGSGPPRRNIAAPPVAQIQSEAEPPGRA
jgi:hypothetical protein